MCEIKLPVPSWGARVLHKGDFYSLSYLQLLFIDTFTRVLCVCVITLIGVKGHVYECPENSGVLDQNQNNSAVLGTLAVQKNCNETI